jgi:hypothetical protein
MHGAKKECTNSPSEKRAEEPLHAAYAHLLSPPIWSPAEWPRSLWNIGTWTMALPDQPHVFGVSQAGCAAAVSDAVCVPASLWCDRGGAEGRPSAR